MDNLHTFEAETEERFTDCEEDEHDLSLTKAANKSLDLSRSLTDHCNKLADLDVDDFLLPGEADLPDDEDIPTELQLLQRPDHALIATPDSDLKQARRKKVVREILETEKSYCSGLWLLLDHFIDSIRRSRLVTEDVLGIMFTSSLEEIYKSHCDLLQNLEIRFINWSQSSCIGDIFADVFRSHNCPIFQQYQMYIRNFSSSLVKIHKMCNGSADFFNLLKVLEEDQKCNRLDITSFLLTPVQRIPRYVLLLKQLLRFTSPAHDDWILISCSLQDLGTFLNRLNSSIEHSINLVSVKRGIKPKKRFGISLSFRLSIQPPRKLKRQSSSRQKSNQHLPPNFDPKTSTPMKNGNEANRPIFEECLTDANVSYIDEKQEKDSTLNETCTKSLYTYEEYLVSSPSRMDGFNEETKKVEQGASASALPSNLFPPAAITKTEVKSRFSTLRKNMGLKSKKGPVMATHNIANLEQEAAQASTKPIKRTMSGSSSFVKERWLKRFKPSPEVGFDESDNISIKSTKRSLKDSIMGIFKSLPAMPRSQNSVSSLASISSSTTTKYSS